MSLHAVLDAMYQGQTLVFGHRGASAYAPMNTIPAFELAAEQGADGIELDVHRSRDGAVVVIHDFTVENATAANGSAKITDMTLAQIKELDVGEWFDDRFSGTQVPTLDEIFEAVGSRLYINVEIKSVSLKTDGVEQAVADIIARHDMKQRVIVSSFNPLALVRFRQIIPDVPLGYLYAPEMPTLPSQMMVSLTYEATHPYHEMIDEEFVTEAKRNNYRVNTWTVNDPARAIQLSDMGVDLIITDKPDVIREALIARAV
jgi:glycerophosphoryl diester phosphodiesterase